MELCLVKRESTIRARWNLRPQPLSLTVLVPSRFKMHPGPTTARGVFVQTCKRTCPDCGTHPTIARVADPANSRQLPPRTRAPGLIMEPDQTTTADAQPGWQAGAQPGATLRRMPRQARTQANKPSPPVQRSGVCVHASVARLLNEVCVWQHVTCMHAIFDMHAHASYLTQEEPEVETRDGIYKSSEFKGSESSSLDECDPRHAHLPFVDNLEAFLATRTSSRRNSDDNVDLQ